MPLNKRVEEIRRDRGILEDSILALCKKFEAKHPGLTVTAMWRRHVADDGVTAIVQVDGAKPFEEGAKDAGTNSAVLPSGG